jgi:hypothetical protein
MRINRSYAMAAAAWLVLVVVGAVLVWAVISRAGQGVVSSQPGSSIGGAAPITAAPRHKHTGKQKSAKPRQHRPSGSASTAPGGGSPKSGPSKPRASSSTPKSAPQSPAPPSASSAPNPGPAPGPGAGSGPKPSSSPNNPPPSSSPPPPKSTQDSGVTRSWQGSAGVVTVECRGPNISLKGAQPNSGWSIDVDRRGPDEVRVDFESGERRTRVQAECVGGTPRFDVDQGDD